MTSKESWPRLTEDLPGPRTPVACQACGEGENLTRWQEHDDLDRPEHRVVVLCHTCAEQWIEPHPRLYAALGPYDPFPGCMAICLDCVHRDGTRCTHPRANANGGTGVELSIKAPSQVHFYRRGKGARSGWETVWTRPARACAQKEVSTVDSGEGSV